MGQKTRKLKFSQFCTFLLYCVYFTPDPTLVITLNVHWKSFSLQLPHYNSQIYEVASSLNTLEFHIWKNLTIWLLKIKNFNSKLKTLFVTSIIQFVIIIFVILTGYWEYCPNTVNYVSFSANPMSLEMFSTTILTPYMPLLILSHSLN